MKRLEIKGIEFTLQEKIRIGNKLYFGEEDITLHVGLNLVHLEQLKLKI